ncbi:hypothetical protein [Emcibacter nanhaiensis]|uniref:Uncharacterized protein n=1 Tax=Emcibacter nanhaiensis TaxID=1505037 RepID=A0A501PVJ5_9PROT|nr:hypothetical protein [Emcibacter nanhaiensis]TPD64004.1 hypothetical protein FIV46_00060 [Emcibacter nanhaiensis]
MIEEKELDLAIKIYEDTRAEMRLRIELRDKQLAQYLFATIAFIGVSLGLPNTIELDTKILVCCVMLVSQRHKQRLER